MFAELLRDRLAGICEISDAQIQQLQRHFELLQRWNRVMNLTAVRSPADIVERHYCESLFLAANLPPVPSTVADIGSGAGFPGFPVAVARSDCRITLIESHQRKAVFLREASRGMQNVRVLARRAGDIHETFDWAVTRAVRYGAIAEDLARLGRNRAVLAGEVPPPGDRDFAKRIRLPWGERRFLYISRGT